LKETRKCGSILEERPPPSPSSAVHVNVTAVGAATASNASSVKKWDANTKSSKVGSCSSRNSSSNKGQSIRNILTVDDDDDDDVIICVDTPEKPSKPRVEKEDRSNFSDDSDQPIYSMIQKRKRIQADEAQRSRVVRSPSLNSDS
jgi:hypothetical protein